MKISFKPKNSLFNIDDMKILLNIIFLFISINVNAQCFTSAFPTHISCNGSCDGTANVTANGTAPYSYLWSTGDTTSSINGLCAGTYTVITTDDSACVVYDTLVVNEPPPLYAVVTATAASCPTCCDVCVGFIAQGGTTGYTYVWSPYDPNFPSPCNTCPGETFSVYIVDANGCTVQTDTITTDTVAVNLGINAVKTLSFELYPNPASELVHIRFNSKQNKRIILFDINGKEVYSIQTKEEEITLDVSAYPKGQYLLQVYNTETKTFSLKKLNLQ